MRAEVQKLETLILNSYLLEASSLVTSELPPCARTFETILKKRILGQLNRYYITPASQLEFQKSTIAVM